MCRSIQRVNALAELPRWSRPLPVAAPAAGRPGDLCSSLKHLQVLEAAAGKLGLPGSWGCIGFAVSGRPGSSQLRCQVLVVRKLVSARTAPFGPGPRVQLYMVCNGLLKLGREFRGLAASDRSCGSLRKPRQLSLCTVIARSPHPRWVPQL